MSVCRGVFMVWHLVYGEGRRPMCLVTLWALALRIWSKFLYVSGESGSVCVPVRSPHGPMGYVAGRMFVCTRVPLWALALRVWFIWRKISYVSGWHVSTPGNPLAVALWTGLLSYVPGPASYVRGVVICVCVPPFWLRLRSW